MHLWTTGKRTTARLCDDDDRLCRRHTQIFGARYGSASGPNIDLPWPARKCIGENSQKVSRTQLSCGECLDFVNGKRKTALASCAPSATVTNELILFSAGGLAAGWAPSKKRKGRLCVRCFFLEPRRDLVKGRSYPRYPVHALSGRETHNTHREKT